MRGVVLLGNRRSEVREFADPQPGWGEVVVRLKAGGLCGSDLHRYRQDATQRAGNVTISGHEPCGVVECLGNGVTNVRVGERVSVYHYRGCGYCKECLGGSLMWCAASRGYGVAIHGSNADFILTDARNCLPLPTELSFACGAMMACNAGTAFSSLRKLHPFGGETVAIFGQGPVGLAGTLFAKAMGTRVIAIEPTAERRKLARALGADETIDPNADDANSAVKELTRGEGADCSFETSGSSSGVNGAVDCLRRGGRAVFVGKHEDKALAPSQIIGRQLTLMGSFVLPIYMYHDMLRLILDRGVPLEAMVTHRLPLEMAQEAFALFDSGKTGKVLFEWA